MKQSILIATAVVVGIAVILIFWRVGFHRTTADQSSVDSRSGVGLGGKQSEQDLTPRPPGDPRSRYLSATERATSREQRRQMLEKMASMSGEERERLRAEMRERFRSGRQRESARFRSVSPEERARLKEQDEKMRERWRNMSEEERKQFLAQMREKGRSWVDLSEQEREKIRAEMDNRVDPNRQEND